MSKTLTVSDEVYDSLQAEAKRRGVESVERLLETFTAVEVELARRDRAVRRIEETRRVLDAKYGMMPDSVDLIREDRSR